MRTIKVLIVYESEKRKRATLWNINKGYGKGIIQFRWEKYSSLVMQSMFGTTCVLTNRAADGMALCAFLSVGV